MALLQDIQMRLDYNRIPCELAYPNRRMPRLLNPTVMIRFSERSLEPFCLDNYMGQKASEPIYAAMLKETVICEIYSPYLSGGYECETLTDSVFVGVSDLLFDPTPICITRTPTFYDPDTDCFRATVVVSADSWVKCPQRLR